MGFLVKGVKSVVKAVVGVASKVVSTIVGPIVGLFKPKKQAKASSNLRLNKSLEPEAYRKIIFGRTASGLDVRFWQVWGAKGTLYDEVLAAAGHRINGFAETYFGDELAFNAAGVAQGKWAGVVTRETRLGTDDQVGMNVAGGSLWNAQSAPFTGVAHFKLAWTPTEEKLPNGVPNRYTQVVEGALLYDPRRDSTVGGSGTHRINDRSTWSYSTVDPYGQPIGRNNALQVLWYLLGWYVKNPVSGELVLVAGRGVEPSDINIAAFAQAANDAEAAGYYTDCILSTEDAHTSNEDKLTSGGLMGQLIDEGGLWSYYVNVDDTANVALELTDDDVIEGASTTWNEYRPISEQYQQVNGKFIDPSPAALFQTNGYPAVRDTNYEALTGLKRRKTQDFEVVQDVMLAQKLARLLLNMGQYQAEFASSFLYRALQARVWSIVRYRSERFGWNKLFRVYRHDISVDSGIAMLLREIHPSIYGAGSVVQPEAPSKGVKYDPRQEIPVTGIVYAAQVVSSGNGFSQDGVLIGWDVPPGNTKYTEVRLRKQGDEYWQTYSPNKGDRFVSIVPIVSGTLYEFQVRHVSIHEVPGPWTPQPPMVFAGGTSSTTPWTNVSDPTQTKPEDNATVGAPDWTNVGNRPVPDLLRDVDATLKGIDDLEKIYGDTATAAESARVAEQAKKDAEAAYVASDAAKAEAIRNASAAAVSASNADGFARTASGQADIATQKATESGQEAVNAKAWADSAATQAGQADIYRSQAATSASNAEGSRNAAVIAQGVAASNKDATQEIFNSTYPPVLDPIGRQAYNLIPPNAPIDGPNSGWPSPYIVYFPTGLTGENGLSHKKYINRAPGKKVKVSISCWSYATNAQFIWAFGEVDNENGAGFVFRGFGPGANPNTVGWFGLEFEIDHNALSKPYIVPYFIVRSIDGNPINGGFHLTGIQVTDVTQEKAAQTFANASAESASSAATSRRGAEESASAAITAKTQAETASGNASTSASQASSSAGGAATAQQQAESAASAAGNSASAASGSATAAGRAEASAAEYNRLSAQNADRARADVTEEARVRAGETYALGQEINKVSASVGGFDSRIEENKTAIATVDGKTAARFKVEAIAGNNRAQLSVYADGNAGAGVDIVGDLSIRGDVIVDGTISTREIVAGAITDTSTFTANGDKNVYLNTPLIETPWIFLGAEGYSRAMALLSMIQEPRSSDAGATVRVYIDYGQGYVIRRTFNQGVRASGGGSNAYYRMPITIPLPIVASGQIRIYVEAESFNLGGGFTESIIRNIQIDILRGAR